ncbi:MAG: DUF2513 domain-containing protein [Clostridia bacterium]|nr:DUF2513 domain-containing protein [Clostridia bacterium]MBQ3195614.1 DUF2513 domain-containing protein [Clostridia bacterium]
MRINIDCLRDVLLYCINNLDYIENGYIWKCEVVELKDIYKSEDLQQYPKKDIMYSVLKLKESEYIKISCEQPKEATYINDCVIMDVTMKGHQFAETIKEPTVWEKTKSIANKVGNHTLHFLENLAHDVAVEIAKQTISVMMQQL